MRYVIVHRMTGRYWNHLYGWIDELAQASTYDDKGRDLYSLPSGGMWILDEGERLTS